MEIQRTEMSPAWWKLALLIVGIAAFTVLGVCMIVYGGGIADKASGLLGVIFFGGFGVYSLYLRRNGIERIAVSNQGLEVYFPGWTPRLIPWDQIESFGVFAVGRQKLTTVRLISYEALLRGLTQEQISFAIRTFGGFRIMGQAATVVAIANLNDPSDMLSWLERVS